MADDRVGRDTPTQIPDKREVEKLLKARMSLGHLLDGTHSLTNHDHELIGTFVQSYCIADLEARRVTNCLTHIRTGESTAFALKLNDKDALDKLISCADDCIWNLELAVGIRKAADIFVQHRQIRHIFAHWAGRRIPGHDAFIFFTSNLGPHKAPKGSVKFEEEEEANVKYAIMPITFLREELFKLQGHAQYLARIGPQLDARAAEIARRFASNLAGGTFST